MSFSDVCSDSKNCLTNEKKRNDEAIIQKVTKFWDGDFDALKSY